MGRNIVPRLGAAGRTQLPAPELRDEDDELEALITAAEHSDQD
jgi:hypothetical protein